MVSAHAGRVGQLRERHLVAVGIYVSELHAPLLRLRCALGRTSHHRRRGVQCPNQTCGPPTFQTQGAIYNPVSNTWTAVSPPAGWKFIGDAMAVVLSNGVFMLADCCENKIALLNANSLTWAATGANLD